MRNIAFISLIMRSKQPITPQKYLTDQDDLLILLEGDLVGRHTKKSVGIGSCMGGAGMLKVEPIEKQLLCESKC